ncbi:hypothetical protein MHIB_36960 [Mycolicibacter hiberniae]|uniref:Uncharacterized protein n=3 Tax=Mycolicibacter hiberniae TaxID=29314 RepID=A0A7I7XAA3_9MYCO|nr:hypothetical protein MHIB_36960 [Mycolicibacter hiberniae]
MGAGRRTGSHRVIPGATGTTGTTVAALARRSLGDTVGLHTTGAAVTAVTTIGAVTTVDVDRITGRTGGAGLTRTTGTTDPGRAIGGPATTTGQQTTQTRVTPGATVTTRSPGRRPAISGRVITGTTDTTIATDTGHTVGTTSGLHPTTGETTRAPGAGVTTIATMTTGTTIRVAGRARRAGHTDRTGRTRAALTADTTSTVHTGDRTGPGHPTIATDTTGTTMGARRRTRSYRVIPGTTLAAGTTITAPARRSLGDTIGLHTTGAAVTAAATGLTGRAVDIVLIAIDPGSTVLAVPTITTDTRVARSRPRPIGLHTTQTGITPDTTIAAGRTRQRTRICRRVITMTTDTTIAALTGPPRHTRGRKVPTTGTTTHTTNTRITTGATVTAGTTMHRRGRTRHPDRPGSAVGTRTTVTADTTHTMSARRGTGTTHTTMAAGTTITARGARRRALPQRIKTSATPSAVTTITTITGHRTSDAIGLQATQTTRTAGTTIATTTTIKRGRSAIGPRETRTTIATTATTTGHTTHTTGSLTRRARTTHTT